MPSSSNGNITDGPFRCQHAGCTAVYQRKEHLNRHMVRHNQEERLSCPYCDSTLARSDLLRRHVRKTHPDREPPGLRTAKACKSCHVRKERCAGGYPCNQCQRRKVSCSRNGQAPVSNERDAHLTPPDSEEAMTSPALSDSTWIGQVPVDVYFEKFHPIWPFLHRGTFKIAQEPCVLVQTMLMIGLWIKGDTDSREMAMTFHERLLSAIRAQRFHWQTSESAPPHTKDRPWPMPTYQSVLLQLIFSLIVAKRETQFDLNLRCQLPAPEYELLASLVATCRRLRIFNYPNMIAQHHASTPPALVWVNVEETKRFGLALYKLCRLCAPGNERDTTGGDGRELRSGLLTLQDLEFSMPDTDEVWNSAGDIESQFIQATALRQAGSLGDDRNLNSDEWISSISMKLHDPLVGFDLF